MKSVDARRRRLVAVMCSLAFVGTGAFFALQDLGTAVKYAGVGSFFIGLVGLVMSGASLAVAIRGARQPERARTAPVTPAEPPVARSGRARDTANQIQIGEIIDSQVVYQPDGDVTFNIDKRNYGPDETHARRSRRRPTA
jgi:hypothetical protein